MHLMPMPRRVHPARLALASVLLVGLIAGLALIRPESAAASHCVNDRKLQIITVRNGQGDAFWNYDFEGEQVARCNVDWPIDFIFHGNAEIDRVKNDLRTFAGYSCEARGDCGGRMHARMTDGRDFSWDADAGLKLGLCIGNETHIRLYAAGELDVPDAHDRMFNLRWGFYILGTAHIDNRDCLPGGWAGRSERAEGNVARHVRPIWRISSTQDAPVREDRVWLANRTRPCRRTGFHILCNDGRATTALVAP
jgi:hypothetical protein